MRTCHLFNLNNSTKQIVATQHNHLIRGMTGKRKKDVLDDSSATQKKATGTSIRTMAGESAISVTPSIRAASRKNRVYVFREFIQQTYSKLTEGAVILDVAGGKGDLSWLLTNLDELNSVVVDPRITKSQHIIRSIDYLKKNPEQARERAIPDLPTYQPLAALLPTLTKRSSFKSPRHLRLLVDQELVKAIREHKNNGNVLLWEEYWEKATKRALDAQPLGYKEISADDPENPTIQHASEALHILLSTQLVLGFHPDQATDSAIDLAIVLGVPYCIVPCCVFPQEFPERKLVNGGRVRSYSELIQYLKDHYNPRIGKLPFHFAETARNIVLYSLPNDYSSK